MHKERGFVYFLIVKRHQKLRQAQAIHLPAIIQADSSKMAQKTFIND